MTVETASRTDVGRDRSYNEDTVSITTVADTTLLVVADGMGGHRAGGVASEHAVNRFRTVLDEQLPATGPAQHETLLTDAVRAANAQVRAEATADPELDRMGTTLVAAVVRNNLATVVNVGDSRAYQITDETIKQVTTDHSLVQQLVDRGTLDSDEAADHPQKNVITQALGTNDEVQPDTYQFSTDGTVLLCSDGLTDEVSESVIKTTVMTAETLSEGADELVRRASQVDGGDNISVALGRPEDQ